jgi:hypothetical protein
MERFHVVPHGSWRSVASSSETDVATAWIFAGRKIAFGLEGKHCCYWHDAHVHANSLSRHSDSATSSSCCQNALDPDLLATRLLEVVDR